MKSVGEVLHVSKTGKLVVRLEDSKVPPRIGLYVYSEKGERVGMVVDIIGPVNSPYALVKPLNRETASGLVGSHLYIRITKPRPKARRGRHPSRRGASKARRR